MRLQCHDGSDYVRAVRAGASNGNLTGAIEGAIGEAEATDRTPMALRDHWLADRLAQLHQRLIEFSGAISWQLGLERRRELGAHPGLSHV
ncbi:MAG: hypothetical protein WAN87_05220, partial [Thermoplasmata archaeon]